MNLSIINTMILAVAFLLLFLSAELLYYEYKVQAEYTRKYVHVTTGFITLLFPPMLDNHLYVLVLCSSFLILLMLSKKYNFLRSINKIGRASVGSIMYPVIVYGCFVVSRKYAQDIFYYIPILILAICDPLACLVGRRIKKGRYSFRGNSKSYIASITFFIVAVLISIIVLLHFKFSIRNYFPLILVLAIATTLAESLANKGYDNLSIPVSALLVLVLFQETIEIGL